MIILLNFCFDYISYYDDSPETKERQNNPQSNIHCLLKMLIKLYQYAMDGKVKYTKGSGTLYSYFWHYETTRG